MILKFNWGTRIAILYIGFVAMILTMVYMTMGHKVDLMYKDYYARELNYESTLQNKKNLEALNAPIVVTQDDAQIRIEFPENQLSKLTKGSVSFLRPSDSAFDKQIPLKAMNGSVYSYAKVNLSKGLYLLQVEWTTNGIDYFFEQEVTVN